MNKIVVFFIGIILVTVGYWVQETGHQISTSWFKSIPFLGALAGIGGPIGTLGYGMIVIGIIIVVVSFLMLLLPKPQQRGIAGRGEPMDYEGEKE